MLLLYGYETVRRDWQVAEARPLSHARVYFVLSGDVTYTDERCIRRLRPGYLYVFPTTIPYRLTQDSSNPLLCLYLHINFMPHLLHELLEIAFEADPFLIHLFNTMRSFLCICPSRKISPVMEALSSSLVAYLDSRHLLHSAPDKLARSIKYITAHVQEKISVETLSSLSGYHTQYYIRLFYANMGITPHQYLIHYRMRLGLYNLMSGKSVTETAVSVGYPEVRNFIRSFKKYYGYSPLQIKKLIFIDP